MTKWAQRTRQWIDTAILSEKDGVRYVFDRQIVEAWNRIGKVLGYKTPHEVFFL